MRIKYWALEFIDPTLRKLVNDFEKWWIEQTGEEPTITSIYRIGDSGVHGQLPVRGMDFECQDDELGYDCEQYLNDRWDYDPVRPQKVVCIYHDVGQGKHIHLQVHPRTIANDED